MDILVPIVYFNSMHKIYFASYILALVVFKVKSKVAGEWGGGVTDSQLIKPHKRRLIRL